MRTKQCLIRLNLRGLICTTAPTCSMDSTAERSSEILSVLSCIVKYVFPILYGFVNLLVLIFLIAINSFLTIIIIFELYWSVHRTTIGNHSIDVSAYFKAYCSCCCCLLVIIRLIVWYTRPILSVSGITAYKLRKLLII